MPPQVEVSVASSPQKQQGKPFLNVDAEKPEECLIFLQRATYLSIVQVLHLRKLLRQKAFTKRYFEDEPFYVLNNMTSAGRRMYNKLKGPLDAVRKRALSKIVLQLRARDGHDYDDDEYANLCNEAWTIQLTYGSSGSVQIIRESDGAAMGKLKYNGPGSLENATFELLHELKSIGQVLHPLPSVVDHYFRVYCNQSEYQMDGYKTVSGPLLVSGDGYLCISKMMLNHGSMLFDIQSEFLPSIESAAEGLKRVEEKRKPANILDESLFSDPGVPQAEAFDPEVHTIEAMVPRTPFTPERTADFPEIGDFDAFNMILQAPADEELFSEPFEQPGFQDPVDTLYGITSLNTEASDSQAPDGSDDKLENPRLATSKAKVTSPTLLSDICHEKDKTLVCGDADNTSMAGNVDTDPVSEPTEMSDESSLPRPPARTRKLPPTVVKKEVSPPLKRRGRPRREEASMVARRGSASETPTTTTIVRKGKPSVLKIVASPAAKRRGRPRREEASRVVTRSSAPQTPIPETEKILSTSPIMGPLADGQEAHQRKIDFVTQLFNTTPLVSGDSHSVADADDKLENPRLTTSKTKVASPATVLSTDDGKQKSMVCVDETDPSSKATEVDDDSSLPRRPVQKRKLPPSVVKIEADTPAKKRGRPRRNEASAAARGSTPQMPVPMAEAIFATTPIMGLSPASSLANSGPEVSLQPNVNTVQQFFNTSPLMSVSSALQSEGSAQENPRHQAPNSVTKIFNTSPLMSISSTLQTETSAEAHADQQGLNSVTKYFATTPVMSVSSAQSSVVNPTHQNKYFSTSPIMPLSPASDRSRIGAAGSRQDLDGTLMTERIFTTSPIMGLSPASSLANSVQEVPLQPVADVVTKFFNTSPLMSVSSTLQAVGSAGNRTPLNSSTKYFVTSPIMSVASALQTSVVDRSHDRINALTKYFTTSPIMPRSPISDGQRFSDTESGPNPHTAPLDQHFFCSSPIMKMN